MAERFTAPGGTEYEFEHSSMESQGHWGRHFDLRITIPEQAFIEAGKNQWVPMADAFGDAFRRFLRAYSLEENRVVYFDKTMVSQQDLAEMMTSRPGVMHIGVKGKPSGIVLPLDATPAKGAGKCKCDIQVLAQGGPHDHDCPEIHERRST